MGLRAGQKSIDEVNSFKPRTPWQKFEVWTQADALILGVFRKYCYISQTEVATSREKSQILLGPEPTEIEPSI